MFKLRNPFKKPEAETEGFVPDPAYPGEYRDLVLFLDDERQHMVDLLDCIEHAMNSNDVHQLREAAKLVQRHRREPEMPPDLHSVPDEWIPF